MRRYGLIVYTTSFFYFMVRPMNAIFQIVGDNLCQIAYWRILFHPHLIGSVGASVAKPGLLLLLGFFYDVSLRFFGSAVLVKGVFAFFAAALVYAVAMIAADIAGPVAGIVAACFFVTLTPVLIMYTTGTSVIFFFPLLLLGLRCVSIGRVRFGILMLCGAFLMRQEAVGVLVWIAGLFLVRRQWKLFLFTVVCTGMTLAIHLGTYALLFGDARLFPGGGPGFGYIFDYGPTFIGRLMTAVRDVTTGMGSIVLTLPALTLLTIPAIVMFIRYAHRWIYISVGGLLMFWIVVVSLFHSPIAPRYFEFLIPFIVAFGIGGIFLLAKRLWITRPGRLMIVVLFVFVVMVLMRTPTPVFTQWDQDALQGPVDVPFMRDAQRIIATNAVPKGSRMLTEDDIGYSMVMLDSTYVRFLTPLQLFNVSNEQTRRNMLAGTDYILISKTPFVYYYLWYDPLKEGYTDLFRRSILLMMEDGKPRSIYGVILTPTEQSDNFFVVRVDTVPHTLH